MNINMETDVASCAQCGELFVLSRLVKQTQWLHDLNNVPEPPPGVTHTDMPDGWKITASTYNLTYVLVFALPAVLFLVYLAVTLNEKVAQQGIKTNDIVALCIFVALELFFLCACLLHVLGNIEVRSDQGKGSVFTGIGRVGLTRRFLWSQVVEIQEEPTHYQNGVPTNRIMLIGADISFGTTLLQSRQRWIVDMLRRNLFRMQQKIAASKNPQPSKRADR